MRFHPLRSRLSRGSARQAGPRPALIQRRRDLRHAALPDQRSASRSPGPAGLWAGRHAGHAGALRSQDPGAAPHSRCGRRHRRPDRPRNARGVRTAGRTPQPAEHARVSRGRQSRRPPRAAAGVPQASPSPGRRRVRPVRRRRLRRPAGHARHADPARARRRTLRAPARVARPHAGGVRPAHDRRAAPSAASSPACRSWTR